MFGPESRHPTTPLFLALILCAFLAAACLPVSAAEVTPAPSAPPALLSGEIVCVQAAESAEQPPCVLKVTARAEGQTIHPAVQVSTTGGIRFLDDGGRLLVSANGYQSSTTPLTIRYNETREISFPFQVAEAAALPGTYVITLTSSGSGFDPAQYQNRVPVHVRPDQGRVFGQAAELEQSFGEFRPGLGRLAYAVTPDEDRLGATVHIKVSSDLDGYQPELALSVTDGLAFTDTGQVQLSSPREAGRRFEPINAGGYRILTVDLHLVEGSNGGERRLEAKLPEPVNSGPNGELAPFIFHIDDGRPAGTPSLSVHEAPTLPLPPATTGMTGGGGVIPVTPAAPPGNVAWDAIAFGLDGTLAEIYAERVQGQVSLTWEQFAEQVLVYNPQLRQTGRFMPHEFYHLPRQN